MVLDSYQHFFISFNQLIVISNLDQLSNILSNINSLIILSLIILSLITLSLITLSLLFSSFTFHSFSYTILSLQLQFWVLIQLGEQHRINIFTIHSHVPGCTINNMNITIHVACSRRKQPHSGLCNVSFRSQSL